MLKYQLDNGHLRWLQTLSTALASGWMLNYQFEKTILDGFRWSTALASGWTLNYQLEKDQTLSTALASGWMFNSQLEKDHLRWLQTLSTALA